MLDEYLSLDQASVETGRRTRELRSLVKSGRLPAIRRDGHWYVHRQDIEVWLRAARQRTGAVRQDSLTPVSETRPAESGTAEFQALIGLLREKDEQLAALQEERARLTGQIGFLQGQLAEREVRLRLLEASTIESTDATKAVDGPDGAQVPAGELSAAGPEPLPAATPDASASASAAPAKLDASANGDMPKTSGLDGVSTAGPPGVHRHEGEPRPIALGAAAHPKRSGHDHHDAGKPARGTPAGPRGQEPGVDRGDHVGAAPPGTQGGDATTRDQPDSADRAIGEGSGLAEQGADPAMDGVLPAMPGTEPAAADPGSLAPEAGWPTGISGSAGPARAAPRHWSPLGLLRRWLRPAG